MLYLSQVIGRPVRDKNGEPIGKVADLIVAVGERYPPVTGLVVATDRREIFLPWSAVATIDATGATLQTSTARHRQVPPAARTRSASRSTSWTSRSSTSTDGGWSASTTSASTRSRARCASSPSTSAPPGCLRRLGIEGPYRTLARNLRLPTSTSATSTGRTSIRSRARSPRSSCASRTRGLAELHPADLASIIDQLAPKDRAGVLASLDDEAVADVDRGDGARDAGRGPRGPRARARRRHPRGDEPRRRGRPGGRPVRRDARQEILALMEQDEADEVQELLGYPEDSAGGIMTTEFVAVPATLTAGADDRPAARARARRRDDLLRLRRRRRGPARRRAVAARPDRRQAGRRSISDVMIDEPVAVGLLAEPGRGRPGRRPLQPAGRAGRRRRGSARGHRHRRRRDRHRAARRPGSGACRGSDLRRTAGAMRRRRGPGWRRRGSAGPRGSAAPLGRPGPVRGRPRPSSDRHRQRLRRQRRRRHHDLLARRRQVRLRPAVGPPGDPDRAVRHPGDRRADRPGDRPGADRPDPRALRRPLGRVRRHHDDRGQPRLDGVGVRRHQRRAVAVRGPDRRSAPSLAAVAVITLISRGSFSRVQYFFVGDRDPRLGRLHRLRRSWPTRTGRARRSSLVVPHGTFNGAYMLAVVGTVGTTITPWGQGFIQAYVVDKRLRSDDLARRADRRAHRRASSRTSSPAFIVIACAATLWATGQRDITSAADAAPALGPLAGSGRLDALRGRPAGGVAAGPGRRSPRERLHGVRGVRLGAGRRLALARGAGVLRPAGVLHRVRGAVHAHPRAAADPGHVQRPGDQRPAAAGHPGLRHAPRGRPSDHGSAGQRARST